MRGTVRAGMTMGVATLTTAPRASPPPNPFPPPATPIPSLPDTDPAQPEPCRRLRFTPVSSAPRSAAAGRRPPAPVDRRIELRHRPCRELLGRKRRHGNVRVDPEPLEPEHARRGQADGRPH